MNNRFLLSLLFTSVASLAVSQEATAPPPLVIDFQSYDEGDPPSELTLTDAESKFSIIAESGNKLLRMAPSPIVDGGVLLGSSVKGGVMVSARLRATAKRRSSPRFGVGLHGVGGYRLLVVPAHKELQLMKDDAVVVQVPYLWTSGTWTHLEFSVLKTSDEGSRIEGRAWGEGQTRPDTAQINFVVTTPPGQGKASLWATPYSELPVDFDDVTVTPRP